MMMMMMMMSKQMVLPMVPKFREVAVNNGPTKAGGMKVAQEILVEDTCKSILGDGLHVATPQKE